MSLRFLLCWLALTPALARAAADVPLFSRAVSSSARLAYAKDVTPLLRKYCYSCHGDGKKKGDLALDLFADEAALLRDRKAWEKVLTNLRTREMPPAGKPQPSLAERERLVKYVEDTLFPVDCKNPDPGRVTIRRLNRAEYNHTIRDLVGVDFSPAADFPADDSGYGFDNIGDVLSVPPVLLEKYLAAAEKIMDRAIIAPPALRVRSTRYDAKALEGPVETYVGATGTMRMITQGVATMRFTTTKPGEHRFRIHAAQRVAGQEAARMQVRVDGNVAQTVPVTGTPEAPSVVEFKVLLIAGNHSVSFGLLNPLDGPAGTGTKYARGLAIEFFDLFDPPEAPRPLAQFPLDLLEIGYNAKKLGDGWVALNSVEEDDVAVDFPVAAAGDHVLRVRAWARPEPPERKPVRLAFMVGTRVLSEQVIGNDENAPQLYEAKFTATAGSKPHVRVVVRRDKTGLPPEEAVKWKTGKVQPGTVFVRQFEIEGPPGTANKALPATHTRLIPRTPTAANKAELAREVIGSFARRAYRRPVTTNEVARLVQFVERAEQDNESFETGIKLACQAVLISPHFLFRGELQPEPDNPRAVHPVNEFALASRLSYFLWSSLPDDALFAEAERGTLRKNLEAHVRRMLKDPKARALVDHFAGQWLQLRNLALVTPDKQTFPDFDEPLRAAMQRETELLFETIIKEDRSVLEFLDANYTFVNGRLAKHYGMTGITGEAFRKVSLRGTARLGVLTHGSILTITSNPTRTSPVKRGKWILENILGTPPPPPPPDVPDLEEGAKLTGTLRQRMEQHRANPVCSSCHARMDPIGFGFENFNGIGAWRTQDGGAVIDPSGKLVSGEAFKGPTDLAGVLLKKKSEEFAHCLAEKLLTYALGRGLEYYDRCATEQILKGLAKNQHKFSALVLEVVQSPPFQMRRGEGERVPPAGP